MSEPVSVVWLRRDLRLHDNAALYHALTSGRKVIVLFIFDKVILDQLDDRADQRVEYIHTEILDLHTRLRRAGSSMIVRYGEPLPVWQQLLNEFPVEEVFVNRDYEVYAKDRDKAVSGLLAEHGIAFQAFKDQAIFDHDEILTGSNTPYTVFTPYSRKWLGQLNPFYLKSYPTEKYYDAFHQLEEQPVISLAAMDFKPAGKSFPKKTASDNLLKHYQETRDFPAQKGTSELSLHLRFGTISIRELARQAQATSATYLNELCWRDFYFQVLHHFPHVEKESH